MFIMDSDDGAIGNLHLSESKKIMKVLISTLYLMAGCDRCMLLN